MPDLITRAEQGVLAALLTGDNQRLLTEHLSVTDFTNHTHQAIYQAIQASDPSERDTDRLISAVAAVIDEPGVDKAVLHRMAERAPEPQRASAYAQILIQSAFDRDAATFANPYRAAAELATDPAVAASLNRLAQALADQADTFASSGIESDLSLEAQATVVADVALNREDQVIADIVQHPEQARAVAEWLDPEVFTTEQRKVTFEIAMSLAYDHDPIDAVILTWHVEQARALTILYEGPPQNPDPAGETDYAYLSRLEFTPVPAGTAVLVGRDLLAEHLQASLAQSAAAAAEQARDTQAESRRAQQISADAPLAAAPHIDIRPIER